MRIISKARLKEFWTKHSNAKPGLLSWFKIAQHCNWQNFNDVRKTNQYADMVKGLTVFDICRNEYRIITKIVFPSKRIYIRAVLTHSEYMKGSWKNDPWSSN